MGIDEEEEAALWELCHLDVVVVVDKKLNILQPEMEAVQEVAENKVAAHEWQND